MRWVLLLLMTAIRVPAQPLTLQQAVEQAAATYPSIVEARANAGAAAAGIQLARAAYLPRIDGVVQIDRGTHNNLFGPLLPQQVISAISGPVIAESARTAWGSAIGALVSWEPVDFGQRRAAVDAAGAAGRRASATADRVRFEVEATTADAFLTVLAAQETVASAAAALDRAEVLVTSAAALSAAGLRPDADLERARAEQSAARQQLARAEQAEQTARIALAQLTGQTGADLERAPFRAPAPEISFAGGLHPVLGEQRKAEEEARLRLRLTELAYFPRLQLMANGWGRGSGANVNGGTGGGIAGLGPNVGNWVVGAQMTFSALELPSIRARREADKLRLQSSAARAATAERELSAARDRAQATLAAARRIAKETPIAAGAARRAESQTVARYKAGLATMTELADAQRTLSQAEIDDSLARLNVWRAWLAVAVAQGDLQPFLEAVRK